MTSYVEQYWYKAKKLYLKIVLRRFALAFVLFSVIHCLAQSAVQSFLFSISNGYSSSTSAIVSEARVHKEIPWLIQQRNNLTLKFCDHIPGGKSQTSCETVFQTGVNVSVVPPANLRRNFAVRENTPSHPDFGSPLPPTIDPSHTLVRAGANGTVDVSFDNWETSRNLDEKCVRVLVYANEVLNTSKRENLVFVFLQVWLLVLSYIAVIYDSVPYMLAMIVSRILATAWSAFEIWQTLNIERQFGQLLFGQDSPCNINIYPAYFSTRIGYEIFYLCLNTTALVFTSYFGLRLAQSYRVDTFSGLSPPRQIVRIYKFSTVAQACLHLSLFVSLATMGLWIDQMVSGIGMTAALSSPIPVLITLFASMIVLFLPWTAMGWYALRHEKKRMMTAFLCITLALTSSLVATFCIPTCRWTLVHWSFLASLTVSSIVLLISIFVFGIFCRMNFGEGLLQYLFFEGKTDSTDHWRNFKLPTYKSKEDSVSCSDVSIS